MLFRIENPMALWGFLGIILLLTRFLWKRKKLPDSFSSRKMTLALTALSLCILGLSRPQGGDQVSSQVSQHANLYLAIDVSQSMLAQDTTPSRMNFAVEFARKLMDQLTQVKVALFPFALDGYLLMPLSPDISAARDLLSAMNPSMTTGQGTHLSNSLLTLYRQIQRAEQVARSRASDWVTPQVVLLSDGESHYPIDENVLTAFRKSQIPIFTVSLGSKQGSPIPMENRFGTRENLRDSSGKTVLTQAHPEVMKKIADLSGGYAYTDRFDEVYALANRLKQSLQIGKLSTSFRLQHEFYPLFFVLAFLIFFAEFSFGRWEYALRSLLLVILLATPTFAAEPMPEENEVQVIHRYNQGVESFKNEDFKKAAESFEQTVLGSLDPDVRKQALFNLGNTYLKMGDPEQALQAYQQAYDTKYSESQFDKETNQKISDNIALATRVQEMMKQKAKGEQQSEGGEGSGRPQDGGADPKGPKKFEAEPMPDSMKEKVFDLISNEERQTLQRLAEEQNRKKNIRTEKPW